jgi:Tol biopolymer transport system component
MPNVEEHMASHSEPDGTGGSEAAPRSHGLSRRHFLAAGGVVVTSLAMSDALGRLVGAGEAEAQGQANTVGTSGTVVLDEGSMIQITASPDGEIIIMNLLGMLWSLPASGGEARLLTGLDDDAAYPNWSPQGDRIVFHAYIDGTFHIWSMGRDGSDLRQLTSGGWDDREPVFSPDGTQIAFASDRDGGSYNIWILDVATGGLRKLTNAAADVSDYQPAWSPDGSRIAYVEDTADAQLVVARAASGEGDPTVLYTHARGSVHTPRWSPDGERIAYVHHDPATARPDEGAGHPRLMVNGEAVTDREDVFVFPAHWLAADRLLYTADGKIRERDLTSGEMRNVPFSAPVRFSRADYPRKQHDFDSRRAQPVRGIANPVLSPDGTTVAFVALNQLWTMQLGRNPRQISDDVYYKATPFWSPDGRVLAYSSDREGPEAIYLRDMETGRERKLTGPFAGAQVRGAWSPDGTKIAFLSAHDGSGNASTYVADVDSGEIRRILTPLFEPGRPTWGPNSDVVALAAWRPYSNRFREGQNLILTVDVGTGETTWHDPYPWNTINNRKGDNGPVWSPDGTRMAYVLDDVLWVLPVDERGAPTGPQRQVTDENADMLSWSGDSSTLLYLSDGTMRRVSAAGGSPSTVPVRLRWRQDVPAGVQVIRAGALWDGESTEVFRNVDIVVRRNRIVSVSGRRPARQYRRRYGRRVEFVDASGLTVMPGLWEAHGHEQLDQPYVGGRKGRLMLSLGVTSVMSMGDPAYEALEQKESEVSGVRLTPRYFWAAEPVDGERINYDFMRATANEIALERELQRIRALNPDILKTYVRLPNQWQARAIQVGHEIGILSFSHYTWPALEHDQDACSHFATQRQGYQLSVSVSRTSYEDTIQLYAQSKMGLIQTSMTAGMVGTYPGLVTDQRMLKLLNPWQYSQFQTQYNRTITAAEEASIGQFTENHVRILRAGGIIMGGTDEPLGLNVWGLQPTLAGFVRFGYTRYEALRTMTAIPAQVMGLGADLGTVQRGRIADLCFVRGNPLEDIHSAINVEMVMKNGRLFTVEELIGPYADVDLNTEAMRAARSGQVRTMSAAMVEPTHQIAHLNHDLDVRAVVAADEGRYAPPCVDHTGGGCC